MGLDAAVLVLVLIALAVSVLFLLRVRPTTFIMSGTTGRERNRQDVKLVEAHRQNLYNVTRSYRWLGFYASAVLLVSFPGLIIYVHFNGLGEVGLLTTLFESILFISIRMIFARVDQYDTMLARTLGEPVSSDSVALSSGP